VPPTKRTWPRGCLAQPPGSLTMLIDDEGHNHTAAEYEQQPAEVGFRQPPRVSLNAPGANADIISVSCAAAGGRDYKESSGHGKAFVDSET
jgi:hypothetical protein